MIKCWHYRRIVSNCVSADAALPRPARDHVAQCPACRAHFDSETNLARQLSADANAVRQSPSPFLHARIMTAIAKAPGATETKPTNWRLAWLIGLATACVMLAALLRAGRQHAPVNGTVNLASQRGPALMQISLLGELPKRTQLREWSAKLDEPLETEMQRVVSDAKTAVNSLAANFLPDTVRSSLFQQGAN